MLHSQLGLVWNISFNQFRFYLEKWLSERDITDKWPKSAKTLGRWGKMFAYFYVFFLLLVFLVHEDKLIHILFKEEHPSITYLAHQSGESPEEVTNMEAGTRTPSIISDTGFMSGINWKYLESQYPMIYVTLIQFNLL